MTGVLIKRGEEKERHTERMPYVKMEPPEN